MKFCANVSMLFKEVAFLERFGRAARAGFRGVELWWPGGESLAWMGAWHATTRRETMASD